MRRLILVVFGLLTASHAARAQEPRAPQKPAAAPPGAPTQTPPAATPAPAQSGATPPDHYYSEPPAPPQAGEQPAPSAPREAVPPPTPGVYEPQPPGYPAYPIFEPPPPPEPKHTAPRTAFWLGARVGWFLPFGNLWAQGSDRGSYVSLDGVPWGDYSSSGPMFEVDAGLRFSRHYNVFAAWERAQLSSGDDDDTRYGGQSGGDTDFWGVGIRASSDADKLGFVTEVMLGYRRARATWEDGTELQMTDAPFEARLGLGADIRLSPLFSLSPTLTVGVGSFGEIKLVDKDGNTSKVTTPLDEYDGHGWLTLQIGGHFDLVRSKD